MFSLRGTNKTIFICQWHDSSQRVHIKFLELTCGFFRVPPATLPLFLFFTKAKLGSGGDPSNRSVPRCTLTYKLTPAHAHLLTCTASHSCTHRHTPLTRAHSLTHPLVCSPIHTLTRTHVHTHPFAHGHAPLTASVAFPRGGSPWHPHLWAPICSSTPSRQSPSPRSGTHVGL